MSAGPPWANLGFQEAGATFESPSQNARVWTESWVSHQLFCPSCGAPSISRFTNNRPVADIECASCREEHELKAQKGRFRPEGGRRRLSDDAGAALGHNNNVRPKIRQQLQVLRDQGFLEFVGRGSYRLRVVH